MPEIELSAGTIDYEDTGATGPCSSWPTASASTGRCGPRSSPVCGPTSGCWSRSCRSAATAARCGPTPTSPRTASPACWRSSWTAWTCGTSPSSRTTPVRPSSWSACGTSGSPGSSLTSCEALDNYPPRSPGPPPRRGVQGPRRALPPPAVLPLPVPGPHGVLARRHGEAAAAEGNDRQVVRPTADEPAHPPRSRGSSAGPPGRTATGKRPATFRRSPGRPWSPGAPRTA